MSNEYQLLDGSPRYGIRHEGAPQQDAPAPAIRSEEAAEKASSLSLDQLAGAIDRRLTGSWADTTDPLVEALRADYPEELTAAKALVKIHLGSNRRWLAKAQAARDKALAETVRRRKESGLAHEVLILRLCLLLGMLSLPVYLVATDVDDLFKLVLAGIGCIAVAAVGGFALTVKERLPVMPVIRGPWLNELREDIQDATLVAIVQNKGVELDSKTARAGRRGWESILHAAAAVDTLRN